MNAIGFLNFLVFLCLAVGSLCAFGASIVGYIIGSTEKELATRLLMSTVLLVGTYAFAFVTGV